MRRAALLALVLAGGCRAGELAYHAPATTVGEGRFTARVDTGRRTVVLARDGVPVVTLDAQAFQLGLAEADAAASWDPSELEGSARIRWALPRSLAIAGGEGAAQTTLALDYGGGVAAEVVIGAASASRFTFAFTPSSPDAVLARVVARVTAGQGLYGLGAGADHVEQTGAFRAMQATDAAEPHAPLPLVVGTAGFAIAVRSLRVGAIDVARRAPDAVEATYAVAPLDGVTPDALRLDVSLADDALGVYAEAQAALGVPATPPRFAHGPWVWRSGATAASLAADAAKVRALDLALVGLGIADDPASAVGAFDLDPARFPDPAALVAGLRAAGLHAGVHTAPYSTRAADAVYAPVAVGPSLGPWGPPLDLTRSDAAAHVRGLVHGYAAAGFDTLAIEGAEDVVASRATRRTGWRFADGADERTMHHRYPGLVARVLVDGMIGQDPAAAPVAAPATPAVFTQALRAGGTGGVLRLTDLPASFPGLARGLTRLVAASASGIPFAVAEPRTRDPELLARWVEATALFPILSLGDADGVAPWTVAPEVLGTYARLHLRFLPYLWTLADRVGTAPIVRPTGLVDPAVRAEDELLVGPDLLVAPVLAAGETERSVTFPAGRWYGYWDGAPYAGLATVPAPLATLPLFLREGALVPMLRPSIAALAAGAGVDTYDARPGPLHVLVVPGPARETRVHDGTRIARTVDGAIALTSGATYGEGYVLELLATAAPAGVLRDGAPLETWTWSPERGGTLTITVPAGNATVVLR